ncbi:MAG TPA: helix-turn-helix domain-containing protein [Ktedonobacteraceae bacterium]|nr:helix-turn-helix domain-containing protein [Ktedonobacteraceae bacterium]
MDFLSEGRASDSPYVEMVWRGRAGSDYAPLCPADSRWNLLFLKEHGRVQVSVEGPLTKARLTIQDEGTEWLVIKFTPGTFLSSLAVSNLVNGEAVLPLVAKHSFWLDGSTWHVPDYEHVETFVARLARADVLLYDPVVDAVLQDQPQELSSRTVRRRFLSATGLTPKSFEQIERAKQAAVLLEQGVSLLDTVYQAGYADQPHMTRSLKRFIGYTPAHIARWGKPE